jgi:hypothetical protein
MKYSHALKATSFVAIILVAIGFSFGLLAFAHVPMGIGGSGLTNHIVRMLEIGFLICGVLNGALIVSRIKIGWVALAALVQIAAPYLLTGRTVDLYSVYFLEFLLAA